MDLVATTPRNDLSSTAYCLANPGHEYLIYNPGDDRSFTVMLAKGAYNYEWFNPTSEKVAETGGVTATEGSRSFTAPFDGDAVLYLKQDK
jgi:hypothetical protein